MEQQMQQPVNPTPPQPAKSSSKLWLWIIGGCLGIIILIGFVMAGLAWLGIRTAKNKLNEVKPQIEQYNKEMQDKAKELEKANAEWEQQSKAIQEKMNQAQTETIPQSDSSSEPTL